MHKIFDDKLVDAETNNWVDQYAPQIIRPYLKLSRLDRPIGSWLLILPCWWGLLLSTNNRLNSVDLGTLYIAFACYFGGLLMRGAGCTWNDIADSELDAQVSRTMRRPIPSGQVSKKQAYGWLGLQCFISLCILLTFNALAILLGILSILTVIIYPFAKRFTYWPQFFLGVSFNWGVLLAFAASSNFLTFNSFVLYIAGIFWTIFYDTIYSLQDIEDDKKVGIKSTAILFGENTKVVLAFFSLLTSILISFCFFQVGKQDIFHLIILQSGCLAFFGCLMIQLLTFNFDEPKSCLRAFRASKYAGIILAFFLGLGSLYISIFN
jgi:4-hydroxybenzoate polyprenyltransferase